MKEPNTTHPVDGVQTVEHAVNRWSLNHSWANVWNHTPAPKAPQEAPPGPKATNCSVHENGTLKSEPSDSLPHTSSLST